MTDARTPFTFVACHELRESLGLRARDARELLNALGRVAAGSVFHHMFGQFLRQRSHAAAYTNDFASWAAQELRDRVLAERLAVHDPFECRDLEHVREGLIAIVGGHLSGLPAAPGAARGEPFCFMQSHLIETPTGERAATLSEFRDGLAATDASAVYYHVVEARARGRGSDFAGWFRDSLDRADLAREVERIDVYCSSLERIRARVLLLVDAALGDEAAGPGPGGPRWP